MSDQASRHATAGAIEKTELWARLKRGFMSIGGWGRASAGACLHVRGQAEPKAAPQPCSTAVTAAAVPAGGSTRRRGEWQRHRPHKSNTQLRIALWINLHVTRSILSVRCRYAGSTRAQVRRPGARPRAERGRRRRAAEQLHVRDAAIHPSCRTTVGASRWLRYPSGPHAKVRDARMPGRAGAVNPGVHRPVAGDCVTLWFGQLSLRPGVQRETCSARILFIIACMSLQ